MKLIPVEKAVGTVICHDMTQIIPGGEFKGRRFKKKEILSEKKISRIDFHGREHIYVWENREGYLHENEAAARLKTS